MSSTVLCDARRVAVQTQTGRIDLAVPANIVVAALIPTIVDTASAGGTAHDVPADWQLRRVDGRPLSQWRTLDDNGVRDGDLLILSQVRMPARPMHADDAIAEVAASLERYPRWTPKAAGAAGSIAALICSGLTADALLHGDRRPATVVAALLSVVAFVAATACARVYRQAHAALALGGCAVVWAAAAAYLAVPGDVAAPRLMLTGAVSGAASIIVARGIAVGITAFTAAASVSLLSALAAAVSALLPLTVAAVGALLAAAGVATLAFAARLALWGARARVPSLPGSAAGFHADPDRTHALATGLVCGSCVAAALGAVLTTQAGVVFATVVGVVLVLRTGTYVDLIQVSALIASGAACFASAFLWAVRAHPHIAPWLSLVAAAVAAAGVGMSAASGSASVSPLARRCAELVEYAALAALLPLACWVGGAFDAVRAL